MDFPVEKILKLEGLKVIDTVETTDAYNHPSLIIECDSNLPRPSCPYCNSRNIYSKGTRQKDIRDSDVSGYHVTLRINSRSFQCNDCNKSFTEELPLIKPNTTMTTRFRDELAKKALNRTFDELAYENTISPPTISAAFRSWVDEQDKAREPYIYAPRILGIDEAHLCPEGRGSEAGMRGVFIDNEERRILDITENRRKATVIEWLQNLKEPENLKIVTMDMWKGYREAVYEVFGDDVKIVVGHYHVIQELTKQTTAAVNNITKSYETNNKTKNIRNYKSLIKNNLENFDDEMKFQANRLFKALPEVKLAFALKESFRAIYNLKDRHQAEEAFGKWCKQIPNDVNFKPFKSEERTVRNWYKEIFNFFDCDRVTNAATEALNGKIKKNNRKGNGYSFDVLRAKCLYGAGDKAYYPITSRPFIPSIHSNTTSFDPNKMTNTYFNYFKFDDDDEDDEDTVQYRFGVPIDWLNEEVESGRFFGEVKNEQ